MKKTVLAIAAIVTMSGAAGYTGFEMGQEKAYEQATNKMDVQMNHLASTMNKMNQIVLKNVNKNSCPGEMIMAEDYTCVPSDFYDTMVSEIFIITEVTENGEVRGELRDKTGEGFLYLNSLLAAKGADKLVVGDTVEITWSKESYENEDWLEIQSANELY